MKNNFAFFSNFLKEPIFSVNVNAAEIISVSVISFLIISTTEFTFSSCAIVSILFGNIISDETFSSAFVPSSIPSSKSPKSTFSSPGRVISFDWVTIAANSSAILFFLARANNSLTLFPPFLICSSSRRSNSSSKDKAMTGTFDLTFFFFFVAPGKIDFRMTCLFLPGITLVVIFLSSSNTIA